MTIEYISRIMSDDQSMWADVKVDMDSLCYIVDLYENRRKIRTETLFGKSIEQVEEIAEDLLNETSQLVKV